MSNRYTADSDWHHVTRQAPGYKEAARRHDATRTIRLLAVRQMKVVDERREAGKSVAVQSWCLQGLLKLRDVWPTLPTRQQAWNTAKRHTKRLAAWCERKEREAL